MTSVGSKDRVTRSLRLGSMFLLFTLTFGPAPTRAQQVDAGAVLYEVTEDMYLKDEAGNPVTSPVPGGRRTAVARLSGWARLGTPLCPSWVLSIAPTATQCTVNATGIDDLSLATGTGTLSGTFAVVVQGDNAVDAPEFVVMTGTFAGDADLSLALFGQAPLGFLTRGVGTVDGDAPFTFSGTFRLPYTLGATGQHLRPRRGRDGYYLSDDGRQIKVGNDERSLGVPTVRLEINF